MPIPKPPRSPFGELIDVVIAREKVTAFRLATLVGVHPSMLSTMRLGYRKPAFDTLTLMAERWPLTNDEKIAIFTLYRFIPPGFRIVPEQEDAA